MRTTRTTALKASLFLLLLGATGAGVWATGCSITSTEPPPNYPDKTSYCNGRARAECNAKVVGACAVDAQKCMSHRSTACIDALPVGATYQPRQADGCIAAVSQAFADAVLTATEVKAYQDACLTLFDGSSDVGGACSKDSDCKVSAGLRCLAPTGQASGTCQVPKPAQGGEKCDAANAQCVAGFHCGATKHCDADGVEGDACGAELPCGASALCASSMHCVAKLSDSSTCTSDESCANGLCDLGSNGTSGICTTQIAFSPMEAFCVASR